MPAKARHINTVNVVEADHGNGVQCLRAFPETKAGNKAAELYFSTKLLAHEDKHKRYWAVDDIEDCLDDGSFESPEGYCLYLVHSV